MAKARPIGRSDRSPGGRPRSTPHRSTAFSTWLESGALTVDQVAERLRISRTSVYHLRNSRFSPGLELANAIAELSSGSVPADSWPARSRAPGRRSKRIKRARAAVESSPGRRYARPGEGPSDEALTLAYYLLDYVAAPTSRRPTKIIDPTGTALRWARDIDVLIAGGVAAAKLQQAIGFACSRPGTWRRRINSGAALRRWWPQLRADLG